MMALGPPCLGGLREALKVKGRRRVVSMRVASGVRIDAGSIEAQWEIGVVGSL